MVGLRGSAMQCKMVQGECDVMQGISTKSEFWGETHIGNWLRLSSSDDLSER